MRYCLSYYKKTVNEVKNNEKYKTTNIKPIQNILLINDIIMINEKQSNIE